MSPVFRSRRRAEEFAALVESSAAPGTPVEVGVGMEQARLLELVAGLRARSEAGPTPRPAFTAGLRDRLMAEAATGLVRQETAPLVPDHPRSGRERRLVAAATVSIVLGGTAGMASAAEGALPGQALYPVKRGIEQAQVDLADSAFARGRQLLENASTRLDEVQGLLQSGPVTRATEIPHTLQDFSQQAGEGADLMLRSYRTTGNPQTVATVRQFAASQLHTLKHFASVTPPKAHRDLVVAATTLGAIDGNARVACDDCANIPPLEVPVTLKHHSTEPAALHLTGATSDTTVVADAPPQAPGGDPARGIALIDLAPPPGLPPVDTALPLGAPAAAPAPAGSAPVDPAATPAGDPDVSGPAPAAQDPSTAAPSDAAPVAVTPSAPAPSAPAPSAPAPSAPAPPDPAPSVPPTPVPAPSVPAPSAPDPTDAASAEPPPSDPPSQNVAPSTAAPSPAASAASSAQPGGAAQTGGVAQEPAAGSTPSGLKSSQVPRTQ